uniref:Tubulin-specific chaperone E n=1 Tax=Meloidogyne incognita TaxID=6306 RepID=A0A914LJB8_MELIC
MIGLNKRVMLKEAKGVVKYCGEVEGTTGIWIGVDWDNKERGKHSGSFNGKQYFKALEKDLEFGTDLFDEVNEKYASNSKMDEIKIQDSSKAKLFEFVKMDKIYSKQKQIFKLKCIVLSFSKVSHLNSNKLGQLKFNFCTELDLCSTLIGKWTDLINILFAFPALKILNLDCNRIEPLEDCTTKELENIDNNLDVFKGITQLSVNECNLTSQTWESIDQLGRLPSLEKLNLRRTLLFGSRGVESREIVIAKLPKIIYLDKCDISTPLRKSAEKLFISRFSLPPICQEHKSTLERLKANYGLSNETEKDGKLPPISQYSGIQTRRLFLSFEEKSTRRSLSLSLPLHKVVGLGARLFGFEPDQLKGVEIQRSDPNFPSELIARTKDNLLRQFDLEDRDTIRFV